MSKSYRNQPHEYRTLVAEINITTPDIVRERLKYLHDSLELSWRAIAALDEYRTPEGNIPPGTLNTIYKTGKIPRKWYPHFNLQEYKLAPACPICRVVHVTKRCPKRSVYRDLFATPASILQWQMENRHEYDTAQDDDTARRSSQ